MSLDFNVPILCEGEGRDEPMIIALCSYPLVEVIFRPGAVDASAMGSSVRSPILN